MSHLFLCTYYMYLILCHLPAWDRCNDSVFTINKHHSLRSLEIETMTMKTRHIDLYILVTTENTPNLLE